jgi:hypothetical protein
VIGVWVTSGPGIPAGARVLGDAGDGRVWLDVCLFGQHLPQMYKPDDLHDLTVDGCAALGLCPDCLGFGDLDPTPAGGMLQVMWLARSLDEVSKPCPGCGGTGRPALRVTITRDGAGTTAGLRALPHSYVPPLAGQFDDPLLAAAFEVDPHMCLACGMPPDGTGPRGEALHEPAAE